jgi:hypothetical protein
MDVECWDGIELELCKLLEPEIGKGRAIIHCDRRAHKMGFSHESVVQRRMKELASSVCNQESRFCEKCEGDSGEMANGGSIG